MMAKPGPTVQSLIPIDGYLSLVSENLLGQIPPDTTRLAPTNYNDERGVTVSGSAVSRFLITVLR